MTTQINKGSELHRRIQELIEGGKSNEEAIVQAEVDVEQQRLFEIYKTLSEPAQRYLFDYRESCRVAAGDPAFYALIMAAMRKADSENLTKLQQAWPEVWAALNELYNTPGVL